MKATHALVTTALAATLTLIGVPAYASGSGGGYPSSSTRIPRAEKRIDHTYEYGRYVYQRQLGCNDCPLGDRRLNRRLAKDILDNNGPDMTASLDQNDALAVRYYLRKRFRQ